MRAFRLQTVLQALVKNQPIAQIKNSILIGGALHRLQFLGERALFVDLFQEGRQLGVAKIFPVLLFPPEKAEHIGVLNDEDRILIGEWCVEERVGQPGHGAKLFAVR